MIRLIPRPGGRADFSWYDPHPRANTTPLSPMIGQTPAASVKEARPGEHINPSLRHLMVERARRS